jgi:mRNA interferase YafQ
MALRPAWSKAFKKDWKRISRREWDMEHLRRVMNALANEERLGRDYKTHPLRGEYKGHMACHVEPDFLLIWRTTDTEIRFTRTGTHSDIFDL